MKLWLISDVHLDSHPKNLELWGLLAKQALRDKPDILVVAGDVCERLDVLHEGLKMFSSLEALKIYIPGNHDLWCRQENQVDSLKKLEALLPDVVQANGWYWLSQNPMVMGDYYLVGSAAWYDYSLMPEGHPFETEDFSKKQRGSRQWMDGKWCHFPDQSSETVDFWLRDRFYQELYTDLSRCPFGKKILLFTHFPFYKELLNFTHKDWDFEYFGAFMGSSYYRSLLREFPVTLHGCGHLHRVCDFFSEEGTRVVMAPIGYLKEWGTDSAEVRLQNVLKRLDLE